MALTLIFPINVSIAENNNFIKSLTGFQWSMGLSLTSDEIYVVDGLYNKILVFSKSDIEKNIFDFTDYKNEYFLNENKCVGHVHGISVVDEKIYAVKNNFDCIAVFDLSGNFVDEFGKTGDKNGEFDGPQNLEIFGEKIFVVDTGNDRIQIFDLSGNFVDDIKADFETPHQIVVDEERIYVLDTYNYEIKIFSNSNILNSKNYTTQSNDYFKIEIIIVLSIVIFSIIISYRFLKRKFS